MNEIIKYIDGIKSQTDKTKLTVTCKTLTQIDEVVKYHSKNNETEKAAVIIDIYGLLQSLFVGIDALYSLTIGITNHKFDINVNQNRSLNALKHIRNDIVGHPTNRKYGQNGIAYSTIDFDNLSYDEFIYDTYIFDGTSANNEKTVVDLKKLKDEYCKEKNIIIKRLSDYLNNRIKTINLDNEIMVLYDNPSKQNIDSVRAKFVKNYGNLANHRFIWRLDLVEHSASWQTNDAEIQSLIAYICKQQIIKLLSISNEMEEKYHKLPRTKLPYLLKRFYKYLDKNPFLIEYTKNLHDINSLYYQSDLNYLLKNSDDVGVLKVLNFLKTLTNRDEIYLIGSTIKNYKQKL